MVKALLLLLLPVFSSAQNNYVDQALKRVSFGGVPQPVVIPGVVTITPSTNTFSVNGISNYRADSFVAAGSGVEVNVSSSPLRTFSIVVTGVGGTATSWDMRLEGSLDGVNFTQIMQHTQATGNAQILFSGTTLAPVLYLRSRCAALVLGPATSVTVIILGVQ